GTSIVPLLRGESIAERALYWHLPLYDIRWKLTPCAIIRRGDFKLIEFFGDYFGENGTHIIGQKIELYNLTEDIGETQDLAARMPEKAAELLAELRGWMASIPAEVPSENPYYVPERALMETKEQP